MHQDPMEPSVIASLSFRWNEIGSNKSECAFLVLGRGRAGVLARTDDSHDDLRHPGILRFININKICTNNQSKYPKYNCCCWYEYVGTTTSKSLRRNKFDAIL
jgi:hypothetical protein